MHSLSHEGPSHSTWHVIGQASRLMEVTHNCLQRPLSRIRAELKASGVPNGLRLQSVDLATSPHHGVVLTCNALVDFGIEIAFPDGRKG